MNSLPSDWSEQLQAVYPKRSGPCGWKGVRLMLALRRALFDSSWEQIIDGCKKYAKFCQESGSEGSTFVQAPIRFIEEGSYLEDLRFQAPEDPRVIEARNREADRWRRAREAAHQLNPALEPYPQESVGAFETRISLERNRGPSRSDRNIASLASRLRMP